MHFTTGINRPPYESNSGFLQVTSGCSHKACTFCGYFKNCAFKLSPMSEIEADVREQCLRLNSIGINHFDMLMLGTAGKGRRIECAAASAELLNEIKPKTILINTMTAFPGTKLETDIKSKKIR